jgi:hypothetical protein
MDFRVNSILNDREVYNGVKKEMSRFLPLFIVRETVESTEFWKYLSKLIYDEWDNLKNELNGKGSSSGFVM